MRKINLVWNLDFLKKDLKYMGDNIPWLIVMKITNILCYLMLSITFARFVSRETYGQYNAINALNNLLSIFLLKGMDKAVMQGFAIGKGGIFKEAVKLKIRWGLLGIMASALIGIYNILYADKSFGILSLILAVFLVPADIFNVYQSYLIGNKLFSKMAKYSAIQVFFIVFSTVLAIIFTKNIFIIITVFLFFSSLVSWIFYKISIKNMPLQSLDPDSINYGFHMSGIDIIRIVQDNLDRLMLAFLFSYGDLAIYNIAYSIPQQIKSLMKISMNIVFPKAAEQSLRQSLMAVRRRVPLAFFLGLLFGIIGYFLAPPILLFLYSDKYADSIIYMRWLFLATGLQFPFLLMDTAMMAQKMKKELYFSSTVMPMINLALIGFFVFNYGIMGAVVARLLGWFILSFGVWLIILNKLKK